MSNKLITISHMDKVSFRLPTLSKVVFMYLFFSKRPTSFTFRKFQACNLKLALIPYKVLAHGFNEIFCKVETRSLKKNFLNIRQ